MIGETVMGGITGSGGEEVGKTFNRADLLLLSYR